MSSSGDRFVHAIVEIGKFSFKSGWFVLGFTLCFSTVFCREKRTSVWCLFEIKCAWIVIVVLFFRRSKLWNYQFSWVSMEKIKLFLFLLMWNATIILVVIKNLMHFLVVVRCSNRVLFLVIFRNISVCANKAFLEQMSGSRIAKKYIECDVNHQKICVRNFKSSFYYICGYIL